MTWIVGDKTTIGTLTADVSITDTTFNVSQTVIDNIQVGL